MRRCTSSGSTARSWPSRNRCGLPRSLEVIAAARRHGVPVIVGAQVGETSLLTRAALTVASQARDILLAQEGAFGTLLLGDDVCDPPLMFGPGGQIQFSVPSGS